MKKNYFIKSTRWIAILLMMLGFTLSSEAATIEIGAAGGTSTGQNFPINSCYDYNYNQQIILASEYLVNGAAGNITSAKFYYASNGTGLTSWENWTVYIGHTAKTEFTSTTDWVPVGSMSQVFTGNITAVVGSWVEVVFSTPFNYNGTDNIVIAIDENSAGYSCTANWYSYLAPEGGNRGIRYREDGSNPDPAAPPTANEVLSTLAQIQLEGVAGACPGSSTPSNEVLSFTEVNLDWTTGGATDWFVEYGPAGFAQGSGTLENVTGNDSLNLTGLTSNTAYEWYVRDFCGGTDTSAWVGPNSFYTGYCVPTSSGSATYIDGFSTTNGTTNISNLTTGFTNGGYADYFTTQSVSVPASLSFDFATTIMGGTVGTAIWIDWNNNLIFDASEKVFNTTTYEGDKIGTITVPASTPVGDYAMRVMIDWNASNPSDPCTQATRMEAEDYKLTVLPAPSCVQPTIDSTANLTQTSIDLHWTTGGATNWVVEYGAAGFLPGTGAGTEVTVATTASESLSGLTSSTAYEWYVRDFCGGTDSSAWAGPNSFYTGYCLPASSGSASYLDGFTTTNGTTNISNLATGFTTGGYADYFSAHSVSVPASLSFDFATTIVGGTLGTSIWIDWNNDLVFDASEKVFNTTTYQNDQTGTISVPITTPVGDYAMRVMVDWNASNPSNPCRQTTRMEAEDYKLTVLAVPPCANPNIDSVSNITQTSADLFWTTGGSSNWDIEWGASGFTQGSGTMISNTATNPYNLTGLSAATSYDFYVRDICASDTSVWDGPFTFLTLCPVAYAAPFCEGFEGGSINCWGNETATDQFDWTVNSGGTTSGGTGPSAANGGSQYVYTETSSPIVNGDIAILYSVAVDLTALTTPAIDFYYHMYGAGMDADGTFSVDVSTDGTTWVNLFTKMGNQGNQWNNGYVEMPAYAGDTVIFRFSGIVSSAGTAYENDFALDDFCVIEALPCPGAPSDLSVSNVTAMAADLHWISNFSATDYVVEWDTFGFVQGTGFDFEVNTDTFTSITGLAAQTQYQFYVRDLCGVADSSNWAGPFTFETPCAVYTPDYMEDFTTFVPNCWEKYTDGTSLTGPTGPGSGSWFADGFANNGFSGAAKINIYGSTAQSDWLVSPTFDLSAGGYQLAFDVASAEFGSSTLPAAMGSDDTLALMKSVDGGATWAYEKMWTQGSEPSLAGDRETFMLGTGANTVFAFYGNNGSTSGGDNDLFFDNFVICTPVINATPVDTSFCDGDSIVLANGNSVLTAGMYNDTLIAVSGCDSIFTYNVTVLMPSTSTVDTVVCQGTPLTLPGGTMVSSGGSYDEVYTNAAGCDSTVTYNVTMNVATSSSQDVHLCDGATFTLPLSGTVVSAANSYIEMTPNAAGCDSVITYHVTTGASTSQTLNVSFCAGDSVMLADGTYASAAGTMMVTTTNASGCDDVITYNVTENAVATGSVTASICMGDSYMFDGNMLTTAGTYTMVTTGANSCDSTVTLTLTVNMPTTSSMNAAICMGNTYMFDGNALTTAGTYTMVTPGSNTCDSTVTLTLVVNASSSSSISASICNGDSYMFDGNALTTAGTYTANETNAAGCDSTTTLTLTVDMTADETRSESICNGDTYEFGTQMLTTAGTYTETFTNANGCTYDVTLTLAVNNATSTTEEVALCGDVTEYTLANGTVVTEAGVYTAITPNANGCDNIITYNVSTCVGIFDVENAIGMLAYPNPSVDVLNIEFSEKLSNNNSVMILNVLGQAVYSVENTSDLKLVINTSEFTSGVYYINVTSDNKTSVKSITVSK